MLNKANGLAPFTATELMTDSLKDILDLQKQATGAGSGPGKGAGGGDLDPIDFSAAKSQIAGDEMIVKHLLRKGLVRGSAEFAEQQKTIRIENKIADLPLK